MKNNITIECAGIANLSAQSEGKISIDLQEVDISFIEDIPLSGVAQWVDTEKLLNELDADEVMTWVENTFNVSIKENIWKNY